MTGKQKFSAWSLIASSYLFKFGTALVAGYHYLAKDVVKNSKGGGLFYFFVGIVMVVFVGSITMLVNKMKANEFKSAFKNLMQIGVVIFLQILLSYATLNFELLSKVLSITLFGMGAGTILEIVSVHKYKDYIQEVGIL